MVGRPALRSWGDEFGRAPVEISLGFLMLCCGLKLFAQRRAVGTYISVNRAIPDPLTRVPIFALRQLLEKRRPPDGRNGAKPVHLHKVLIDRMGG